MLKLSPMDIDTLTEVVNIGVGRAASSLSDIIDERIVLKVPRVEVVAFDQLPRVLSEFGNGRHSSVLQMFHGDFTGTSALIFPPESAARLVSVLTGGEVDSPVLDSVRSGTLVEIGNIVINAILGTMGNMLEGNFVFSLPEFRELAHVSEIIQQEDEKKEDGFVMLAEANFNISKLEIQGYIFILFKLESIGNLMEMVHQAHGKNDIG